MASVAAFLPDNRFDYEEWSQWTPKQYIKYETGNNKLKWDSTTYVDGLGLSFLAVKKTFCKKVNGMFCAANEENSGLSQKTQLSLVC